MRPTDPVAETTEQVGPYRIIGSLGRGGMGRLCAATREGVEGFTKVVALKWILPELATTPRFREMFLAEARTAALLDHPSIVATHELGEWQGQYYIAMEYLPGEDLRAAFRRANAIGQRIPVGIAVHMAMACARGLHFAHELTSRDGEAMGIVHRDVNPSNIMLTYHGAVKLLDFGVARAKNRTFQTKTGSFKGKLRYASPEQLAGATVDRRSDVFSLAIVLWESLTGRSLFEADNELAIVDAVRSRQIIAPSTYRGDTPHALDQIVLTALQRDPNHRYPTAAAFAEALAALDVERDREQVLARWLRDLFGAERAAVKLDVARGHQVKGSVERLVAARKDSPASGFESSHTTGAGVSSRLRPRTAWSTDLPIPTTSVPPPTSPPSPPAFSTSPPPPHRTDTGAERPLVEPDLVVASRRGRMGAMIAIAGVVLVGALAVSVLRPGAAASDAGAAHAPPVSVTSTPPGAQIFVAGEPTGLVTPASIKGLAPDQPTVVRLVMPGHAAVERSVVAGESITVTLRPDAGMLTIEGAPPSAELFVDGQSRGLARSIELTVGAHHLWLEENSLIVFEKDLDVAPGEAVLNVAAEKRP